MSIRAGRCIAALSNLPHLDGLLTRTDTGTELPTAYQIRQFYYRNVNCLELKPGRLSDFCFYTFAQMTLRPDVLAAQPMHALRQAR